MPAKTHLKSDATPGSSIGTVPVTDGTGLVAADEPRADAVSSAVQTLQRDSKPFVSAPDSLGSFTKRIGATFWENNARFPWAKDPVSRHSYVFTRYYFDQNLVLDVWSNSNASTRAESQHRQNAIAGENAQRIEAGKKPLGYLSVVRGTLITDAAFDRALAGEVLPLLARQTTGFLV